MLQMHAGNQCFGSTLWDDATGRSSTIAVIGTRCFTAALIILWPRRMLSKQHAAESNSQQILGFSFANAI
jgi:hypothetical protein